KWKPFREQHDLGRHHRHRTPRNKAVQSQHQLGENIDARRPAARPDFVPRSGYVWSIDGLADHFEREIGLHARAQVDVAVLEQWPAAMQRTLRPPQIDRDLAFQPGVDRLAEKMTQQDVFARDGGVGLELEAPLAIRALAIEQ